MSVDIKRLLNKRGWSGKEVGQALLLSLTDRYIQILQGNPDPEPLFTQAQLNKMMQSITDSYEGGIYNRYIGVHNWLMQYQAVANAHLQQLQGAINSLVTAISTASATEEEFLLYEKLPVIMTQKQYDEIRAQRIEEQFTGEDGEELQDTITQLVIAMISFCVKDVSANPRKASPFKAIRKKYMQEKVTDPHILSRYNEVWDRGYYLFRDGRRSDQMTEEEWSKGAATPEVGQALKDMEERGDLFDPTNGMAEQAPAELAANAILRRQHISRHITKEGADFSSLPFSWVLYDDPPEDLCKWDILEELTEAESYYPAMIAEEQASGEYLEELTAFKNEFSEAVEAALKEIDKILGEPISKIPLEEWGSTLHSWRQLYEIDFPGMRDLIEADTSVFSGNYRALGNGIAILKEAAFPAFQKDRGIDERGYYIEPEAGSRLSSSIGLESFTPANEDYILRLEDFERKRQLIEDSIYWLKGFNFVIETLADVVDIPNFIIFKQGINPALDRIDAMNGLVDILTKQIRHTYYPSKEAKETKLQVLSDVFYHFKGDEIEPPEEVKDRAKKAISDLKIFDANDGQLMQLFAPPVREED